MRKHLLQVGLLLTLAVVLLLSGLVSQPAQAQGTFTPVGPTLNPKGEGELLTGIWPRALAFDGSNIWVANGFDNTVLRLDEATGKPVVGALPKVGAQPSALAWVDVQSTMWVASYDDFTLTLVDKAGKVTQTLSPQNGNPLDGHPISMTFANGFIWVVTQAKDGVTKFDPLNFKPIKKISVGEFPTAIVSSFDGRTLWVANGNEDSISVIDTTKDGGSVTATFKEDVPPFPISLTFDGTFLWVGSYECTYKEKACEKSNVKKLNATTGKVTDTGLTLPGRQVALFHSSGHVWVADAHAQSVTDVNSQTNQENGLSARTLLVSPKSSYAGTVLMTSKFVYMADWLNDRVIRIRVPDPIATFTPGPTATNTAIPTVTPIPPTEVPCNPDSNFPPRLLPGDMARVIKEKVTTENIEVNVREKRDRASKSLGTFTINSPPFKVIAGPKPSEDAAKEKLCWYEIESADGALHGFITEGGRKKEEDGTRSRYYIEKVTP